MLDRGEFDFGFSAASFNLCKAILSCSVNALIAFEFIAPANRLSSDQNRRLQMGITCG